MGYGSADEVVLEALHRLDAEGDAEMGLMNDAAYADYLDEELSVGLAAADRGDFYEGSLADLKQQARARHQQRHAKVGLDGSL